MARQSDRVVVVVRSVGSNPAILLSVVLGFIILAPVPAAWADCHLVTKQIVVRNQVVVRYVRVCTSDSPTGGSVTGGTSVASTPTFDPACAKEAAALGVPTESVCPYLNQLTDPLGGGRRGPSMAQIAAAVWRLRLPPSVLHIQPVKGTTLVNFRTNFYATNSPIEWSITLLGQRITVRVWADRYGWTFGDGSSKSTTSAGAPYPDLLVTHTYLRKGRVRPSLTTRYAAQVRIGKGAWTDVPGSANIPTAPQRLRIMTATPVLTG